MKNFMFEIMAYLKNKFNYFASLLQDLLLEQCHRKYYKRNLASRVDTKIALNDKLINWTQFVRIICSPKSAATEEPSVGNSHYIQAE